MRNYIQRDLADYAQQCAQWYPIVSLIGPRQSGKSTLVKHTFPHYTYVTLDDDNMRFLAQTDPLAFLKANKPPLVIDEAQYAPPLFNAIKRTCDETDKPGQYILTGSHNFLLTKRITESLAGRCALLTLLPFAYTELRTAHTVLQKKKAPLTSTPHTSAPPTSGSLTSAPLTSIEASIQRGGYPRLYDKAIPVKRFYQDYLASYVQRDVSDYLGIQNLDAFHTMLYLLADRAGQILNKAKLARDLGIDVKTVKSWLSALKASNLIFMLRPYYKNHSKRLIKSPKLYFYDTGLLCYLLGIESETTLFRSDKFGSVLENYIILERMKYYFNKGEQGRLYYYRDDSKREVDLIDATAEAKSGLISAEIKTAMTYNSKFQRPLMQVSDELGISQDMRYIIMRAERSFSLGGCHIFSLEDWLLHKK